MTEKKVAVYDNPATFRREAWKDGRLVCDVSANLLESKGFRGHPDMPFMLNCGRWETGKLHCGDLAAMQAVPGEE